MAQDVLRLQGMVDQLKAEAEQRKLEDQMKNLRGDNMTRGSISSQGNETRDMDTSEVERIAGALLGSWAGEVEGGHDVRLEVVAALQAEKEQAAKEALE